MLQTINEHEVHVSKLALETEGIPVVVINQRDSSYNAFGYFYVQVHIDNFDRATQIIKDTFSD